MQAVQLTLIQKKTIERDFRRWAVSKEGKYLTDYIIGQAIALKARGFKRYGMKSLFEMARWHVDIQWGPQGREQFKLNNNYTSRLAREIMKMTPQLEGFFETRKLTSV